MIKNLWNTLSLLFIMRNFDDYTGYGIKWLDQSIEEKFKDDIEICNSIILNSNYIKLIFSIENIFI